MGQEGLRLFVGLGRSGNRDLESVDKLDFIAANFWKRDVLFKADGVVPLPIEGFGGKTAEVPNAWKGNLDEFFRESPTCVFRAT